VPPTHCASSPGPDGYRYCKLGNRYRYCKLGTSSLISDSSGPRNL